MSKVYQPVKKKRDKLAAFKIGFGLAFVLQPFEVLRTQMVILNDMDSSFRKRNGLRQTIETFGQINKSKGIVGFWKGSSMAMLKATMSAGIFYTCLEKITELCRPYRVGATKISDLDYKDPT